MELSPADQGAPPWGPARKLSLVVEILLAYGWARNTMRHDDLRAAVARFRTTPTAGRNGPSDLALALRLGRAVSRVLRLAPRRSRCLLQSLVLTRMLSRRGIESSLVIGVAPGPNFAAHAWVEFAHVALLPAAVPTYEPLVRL